MSYKDADLSEDRLSISSMDNWNAIVLGVIRISLLRDEHAIVVFPVRTDVPHFVRREVRLFSLWYSRVRRRLAATHWQPSV